MNPTCTTEPTLLRVLRRAGGWQQDKREGYGSYYYYNGDIYAGTWQNHVRHGHGTYTYGDSGLQWTGTWNNGIRVVDFSMAAVPAAPDNDLVCLSSSSADH